MNPLPPPMPVPPINQPMPMQQGAAPVPVNARRRKRFGDSLETMLSRPPMVASDQMGDMNVFTGQMMNTAARRPVVQQMRGGGNVRQMYRDAYSSPAFKSYTASKKNTYALSAGSTPGKVVKTHADIMADLRSRSSSNDKPKPVAVTRDDDYTPTSAELNEQMKDLAAVGMPDLRQDQSVVQMRQFPDLTDRTRNTLADYSAFQAFTNKYGTQGTPDDRATILAPGTGGLGSVDPVSTGSGMQFGETPIGLMPGASFGQTPVGGGLPSAGYGQTPVGGGLPGMSFGQQPVGGGMPADPNIFISDVFEADPVEVVAGS